MHPNGLLCELHRLLTSNMGAVSERREDWSRGSVRKDRLTGLSHLSIPMPECIKSLHNKKSFAVHTGVHFVLTPGIRDMEEVGGDCNI